MLGGFRKACGVVLVGFILKQRRASVHVPAKVYLFVSLLLNCHIHKTKSKNTEIASIVGSP